MKKLDKLQWKKSQGLVEYGIMLALVALICMAGLANFQKVTGDKINNISIEIEKNRSK
ncbi:Flp family type IVb pilin [Candidatus Riflebacteria bacterium]